MSRARNLPLSGLAMPAFTVEDGIVFLGGIALVLFARTALLPNPRQTGRARASAPIAHRFAQNAPANGGGLSALSLWRPGPDLSCTDARGTHPDVGTQT
jgi:hypothetical protein